MYTPPPLRVPNFAGFHGYDNRYNLQVLKSKVRFNFFQNLKRAVDAFWDCQNVSEVRFPICPSQNASAGQIKNERFQKSSCGTLLRPAVTEKPTAVTAVTAVRGRNNVEQEDLLARLLIWPVDGF